MNKDDTRTKDNKEKLKALREERKDIIDRNKVLLKKQNSEISLIKKELKNGPRTVPELANSTGLESDKVLWYISGLRKYGEIEEGEEAGGYFKYALVKPAPTEKQAT